MTEREDELKLELIVAEERRNETVEDTSADAGGDGSVQFPSSPHMEADQITFIEERDVRLQQGVWNSPQSDDELGDLQHLPIRASGELENFLVVADEPSFDVRVEIDDHNVIDDSFSFVRSISNELTKIGAYSTVDGVYVVSVTDYSFDERIHVALRPTDDTVSFNIIRVEIELE